MTLASATGTIITAIDTGEITMPLQPAFLALQASTASNVTGDGTAYTLGTTVDLTEIYDQNADFDPTSGIFTAPITGRYFFQTTITLVDVATNSMTCSFTTSNRTINTGMMTLTGSHASGYYRFTFSAYSDMDAADTCYTGVVVSGGAKIVDLLGGTPDINTAFGGHLEC
jgi:hypothetical protein